MFRPVILTLLGIVAGLDLLLLGGLEIVSATRAYVAGESMWAKGQKDSIAALLRYAESRDPADYARYERAIAIPLGDHRARIALEQRELDWHVAREGLLAGGNHPDDVTRMVRLVRWGRWEPHVARALDLWARGDRDIARTTELAARLRAEVSRSPNPHRVAAITRDLRAVNEHVTPLEVAFSNTLGDAARQIQVTSAVAVILSSLVLLGAGATMLGRLLAEIDRSTDELSNSESRKTAILNASLDAVMTMDAAGRIVEFSRSAEQMFGFAREAVLGRELITVVGPPEVRDRHREGLQRVVAGGPARVLGRRIEMPALRADGTQFPAEITIAKVETSGAPLFTGFIRDLTDRKRAEIELQRFGDIVAHMQLGLYVWQLVDDEDPAGFRLVAANPASSTTTGVARETILGLRMREAFPGLIDDALLAALNDVARSGGSRELGEIHYLTGGISLIFSARVFPLPDRCAGMIFENITERKRLEAELGRAQKLDVVGRLAGGVAHDFNNILTALLGFGEVLRERLDNQGIAAPELHEMHHAAERARALTSQLLAFSRKQMLRVESVDVNALVERDARLVGRLIGEHIVLRFDLAPSLGTIRGDAAQLGQVFLNLAVNARDAMPHGGTLHIETRSVHVDTSSDDPGSVPPGDYVRLRVADTGVGIPRDVLPHIFEPFFTTKDIGQGSGLGLATVYGIIKQLGGDVRVASTPGEGTRFDILLPAEPATGRPVDVVSVPRAHEPAGSECILLVEDEPAVRELVHRILDRQGYRVVVAASGDEALDLATERALAVDILLTDAVMPGMSGPNLAMALINRYPALKVLVMSGFTEHPMLTSTTTRFRLLAKPFRPDDLLRAVREQLDAA